MFKPTLLFCNGAPATSQAPQSPYLDTDDATLQRWWNGTGFTGRSDLVSRCPPKHPLARHRNLISSTLLPAGARIRENQMRRVHLIIGALVLLTAALLTTNKLTTVPASAATAQITVKGSLVAGMKTAQSGVPVMLDFKVTNTGSTVYGSGDSYFMSYFVSSNASITSVECVQNQFKPSHYDISSEAKNVCQLQGLPAHSTNQGAIDVEVNADPPNLTVEACVGSTPNSKTYCGTINVPLDD